MTNNGNHAPPGPKGLPILGLALDVRNDALGTLQRMARQYGDIVSMPVLRMNRILLNRPDYIQQLLILDHAKLAQEHPDETRRRPFAWARPADQRR